MIAALLLLILGTCVLILAVQTRRLTIESFHRLLGGYSKREIQNHQDIWDIRSFLKTLETCGIPPPPALQDLFSAEYASIVRESSRWPPAQNVLDGVDRFGTPYLYEVEFLGRFDGRSSGTTYYDVVVRSLGANRRDDNGAGDDYEIRVHLMILDSFRRVWERESSASREHRRAFPPSSR